MAEITTATAPHREKRPPHRTAVAVEKSQVCCSGLYYKDQDSKCAVRFDGKKFTAPSGDWAKRTYYAAPGQRCLAPNHLGSYETATKQFEKSVLAVKQMLGVADLQTLSGRPRRERSSKVSSTTKDEAARGGAEEKVEQVLLRTEESSPGRERRREHLQPLTAIAERQKMLETADRDLTPIEMQFVDLARISTGKDAIIEKLREEIKQLHDSLKERERELKEKELFCTDLQSRQKAQEEELALFRKLSAENVYTGNQIASLSDRLAEKDNQFTEYRKNAENEITELKNELNEAAKKSCAQNDNIEKQKENIAELTAELNRLEQSQVEFESLRKSSNAEIETNGQMRAEIERLQKENEDLTERLKEMTTAWEETNSLESGLVKENTAMKEKIAELEHRLSNYDETLSRLNEDWKSQVNEKQEEWSRTRTQLETEMESLRSQVAQQQKLLDEMTREATEAMRRAETLEAARSELLERANASEFKNQEGLKRQVRQLSEDLRYAEDKVAELTGLVASLATDAHSTRRDISDLL
ncbi:hypothetical protein WR25_00628 [Diploscapter pachys]|uniref:TAR DNA-binding protein 43 N-terminal domain-containing protein n=1 Tax=Diploscapter pachys TaxID=2018661 RepID=A0A2A2L6V3_9BILA|nr:hypothetical protein WR25_00628 [Diploscapter pachys]